MKIEGSENMKIALTPPTKEQENGASNDAETEAG